MKQIIISRSFRLHTFLKYFHSKLFWEETLKKNGNLAINQMETFDSILQNRKKRGENYKKNTQH